MLQLLCIDVLTDTALYHEKEKSLPKAVFNPPRSDLLRNASKSMWTKSSVRTPRFAELLRKLDLLLFVKPSETRDINSIDKMRRKLIILSSE